MAYMPPFTPPARFTDPAEALTQVRAIYDTGLDHLRDAMQRFVAGASLPGPFHASDRKIDQPTISSGLKKYAISIAAFSSESEP